MTSTALVYQVEDSASQHRPMHRKPCYTLLQVLMGILVVLMLALAGGVIWMKLSQDCGGQHSDAIPVKIWNVGITEGSQTKVYSTNFTSPSERKYLIYGRIFTKPTDETCDFNNFLLQEQNGNRITKQNISEWFAEAGVSLAAGTGLMIKLNCYKIDTDKSILKVLQHV